MSGPVILTEGSEVLLRQIHPNWFQRGEVLRVAFGPFPHEQGKVSTRREAMGAKPAYDAWIADGYQSVGTMGIAVAEAVDVSLVCVDDSGIGDNPEHHASIDFVHHETSGQRIQAARKLREHAVARGWLYTP